MRVVVRRLTDEGPVGLSHSIVDEARLDGISQNHLNIQITQTYEGVYT